MPPLLKMLHHPAASSHPELRLTIVWEVPHLSHPRQALAVVHIRQQHLTFRDLVSATRFPMSPGPRQPFKWVRPEVYPLFAAVGLGCVAAVVIVGHSFFGVSPLILLSCC